MSLVRWDPFADVDSLFNRMMPRSGRFPRLAMEDDGGVTFEWSPTADISETEKEYLVRAELPGLNKDEVKVTVAATQRWHRVVGYAGGIRLPRSEESWCPRGSVR